ncbi:MAG: amino acid transport protein [Candidatus Omnitrophica bacterium]|nr:amino acid transport protein [Candidatus Omnitrophota bacterium]
MAASFIISLIFGSVGFVAFVYGKKNSEYKPMIIGIILMAYPYFISEIWAMTGIGIALTAALFIWRD